MAKVEYVAPGYVTEGYYQTGVSIDWATYTIFIPKFFSAQIQTVPSEIRTMDINLLRQALKDIEDSAIGMVYPDTHAHNTTVEVGGVLLSRVVEILAPYTVTFEDGPYAINLAGANSNVGDRVNVNQVSIRSANSAGLQDLSTIISSAYQGEVVLDVLKGQQGTTRPIGTVGTPSNNLVDTRTILNTEGLDTVKVQGHLTLDSGDFSDGVTFRGQNPIAAAVTILDAVDVNNCEFNNLSVSGVVDNNNVLKHCLASNITSYDGRLVSCGLSGLITLGGEGDTVMEDCSTVSGTATVSIGTGSGLNIIEYTGKLTLTGKTGTDDTIIDMTSGTVFIDASCTAGTIEVGGIGHVIDNSGIGCHVIDRMLSGAKVDNLEPLIELTRRSHGSSGTIIYWDPYLGSNTYDGLHKNRGKKTFEAAQQLATSGAHDVIIGMSSDPSGITIVDENLVISVESLRVRALARSFRLSTTSTLLPAIEVASDNVEITGFTIATPTNCTEHGIKADSVDNTLILENWVYEGGKGIQISGTSRDTIIRNCRIAHNIGDGVSIEDSSEHTAIENCHVSSNTGNGVSITSTGHETSITEGSVLHGNSGYGVDISANSTGVHILETVTIYNNTVGNVNDLASDTFDASDTVEARVWGIDKSALEAKTDSIGYFVAKKLLTLAKFIGLK